MTQTAETFQAWDEDDPSQGVEVRGVPPLKTLHQQVDAMNADFNFIAHWLPMAVKRGAPGRGVDLCGVAGAGVLWAEYSGSRPYRSRAAIMEYLVTVGIKFANPNVPEFAEVFSMTYQSFNGPGPMIALTSESVSDIVALGPESTEVAFAVHSLRREFTHLYVPEVEPATT